MQEEELDAFFISYFVILIFDTRYLTTKILFPRKVTVCRHKNFVDVRDFKDI